MAADDEHFEYSSREVSPPGLLLQQLITANRTFLLHHGASLSDVFVKLSREKFCSSLDRYWMRFCRHWYVLLHGNPVVDVFGGLKLASGGELGYGVGEEEWGSGEREVLEDLIYRTEGLVDLIVSRFGEAESTPLDEAAPIEKQQLEEERARGLPWLGCGHEPTAPDGVVFGGIGAITRTSLRDVSTWVQQIYTHGEHAYGVRDNPHRQHRKRRRRYAPQDFAVEDEEVKNLAPPQERREQRQSFSRLLPKDPRPQVHDRVASHDHATGTANAQIASHPGVPPPIVSAAEDALAKATSAADGEAKGSPEQEGEPKSAYGVSDTWMKYLTFGLSTLRTGAPQPSQRPQGPRRTSTSSSRTLKPTSTIGRSSSGETLIKPSVLHEEEAAMQYIEPAPDGHQLLAQIAHQRRIESRGHFLIGYRGDLESEPTEQEQTDDSVDDDVGERTFLRTLQIELVPRQRSYGDDLDEALERQQSRTSLDTPATDSKRRRLRVLVYVQRPFIYTFLFQPDTPSLFISSFYRGLHRHLSPLHKPLLSSTSVAKVAQRIVDSHTQPPEPDSISVHNPPYEPPKTSPPVFDLVYDPLTLTVHTSIPNVPEPGTSAAEGIVTTSSGKDGPPPWTRIEALNVHSQILSTLGSTKDARSETERTSKTTRGWWVVWLRLPSSSSSANADADADTEDKMQRDSDRQVEEGERLEDCRQAFLIRKASDYVAPRSMSLGSRVSSGMFGLGSSRREDDAGGRGGAGILAGGIGIDARRYVEGLLSLNR